MVADEVERQGVAGRNLARAHLALRRLLQAIAVADLRVRDAGLREERRLPVRVAVDDAESE
jgi:hypothetical protein